MRRMCRVSRESGEMGVACGKKEKIYAMIHGKQVTEGKVKAGVSKRKSCIALPRICHI
jgi:hypothetical protein